MTMSVILYMYSVYHMTIQKSFLSPLKVKYINEKCIVVTDVVMTLLVPAESVNTRVVIIYKYYIPGRVIVRMFTLRK